MTDIYTSSDRKIFCGDGDELCRDRWEWGRICVPTQLSNLWKSNYTVPSVWIWLEQKPWTGLWKLCCIY